MWLKGRLSFGRLRPFEALRSPQDLEEMVSRVEPLARGAS